MSYTNVLMHIPLCSLPFFSYVCYRLDGYVFVSGSVSCIPKAYAGHSSIPISVPGVSQCDVHVGFFFCFFTSNRLKQFLVLLVLQRFASPTLKHRMALKGDFRVTSKKRPR